MTNDEKFQEWNAINKRFQAWWEKCKEEYDIAGTTSYEYAQMAFHARDAEIATLNDTIAGLTAEVNEGGWMDKFNVCCRRKKELHGRIHQLQAQVKALRELERVCREMEKWEVSYVQCKQCRHQQKAWGKEWCLIHETDKEELDEQRRAALALCSESESQ